jgi:hypothetical protein
MCGLAHLLVLSSREYSCMYKLYCTVAFVIGTVRTRYVLYTVSILKQKLIWGLLGKWNNQGLQYSMIDYSFLASLQKKG